MSVVGLHARADGLCSQSAGYSAAEKAGVLGVPADMEVSRRFMPLVAFHPEKYSGVAARSRSLPSTERRLDRRRCLHRLISCERADGSMMAIGLSTGDVGNPGIRFVWGLAIVGSRGHGCPRQFSEGSMFRRTRSDRRRGGVDCEIRGRHLLRMAGADLDRADTHMRIGLSYRGSWGRSRSNCSSGRGLASTHE
jgi:hypothetical protein